MSSSRRFAAGVLAGVLGCALLLFVPAILVDPTTYVGGRWPGKPQLCERGIRVEARVGKLLALTGAHSQELLLGNSRVADGFDEQMTLQQIGRSVMNLGVQGATLEELEVAFDEALRGGGVRRIWLGVDYGMFEQDTPPLLKALASSSFARLRAAIMSPDVIGMSYAALFGGRCDVAEMTAQGFVGPARYLERARALGWDQLLERSRIKMERSFAGIAGADPHRRASLERARRSTLERMLQRAQAAEVAVVLFVGPAHPQHFDAIRSAGLETDFQHWRRELRALGERNAVAVFDFSDEGVTRDMDLASCDAAGGVSCSMYDVNHYRPTVGAQMLKVMLQSLGAPARTLALH